jgi:glycosyltransferase involved in cell wall biosynthesis
VLKDIAKFQPTVAVTNGFTLLTAYLVLLKLTIGCRIIVLWQGVSPETGGGPRSLRLLFRRLLARHVDLLISNTKEGAEYLLNTVEASRQKVVHRVFEVAEREALIEAAKQDGFTFRSPRPVFLFVGRLIRGKGVHKLLEACSLLIHKGVDNFSLVIVGEGKHADEFRRFTIRSGLAQHIQWERPVGYKQLGAYYDSCDVFVLPSLEDTWGVVVMEAMTMGKPVLCSARAGVREMVAHGVNGFIFDPENPPALADYMERLIADAGLRRQFGIASREIVRHYTPQNVAMMFASYFRQLAASSA